MVAIVIDSDVIRCGDFSTTVQEKFQISPS